MGTPVRIKDFKIKKYLKKKKEKLNICHNKIYILDTASSGLWIMLRRNIEVKVGGKEY